MALSRKTVSHVQYLIRLMLVSADPSADSTKDWEMFEEDPEFYLQYRLKLEKTLASGFEAIWSGSPAQARLEKETIQHMRDMIQDPRLLQTLLPKFELGCRRFTPGDHYLHALQQDNVSVISDSIVRMTEKGIVDATGTVTECDIIICATGFDASFEPRIPTIGRDGYSLSENWGKDKPTEAYMGAVVARFPNLFGMISFPSTSIAIYHLKRYDYFKVVCFDCLRG